MDIKAELKWMYQELENVNDPTFIEAIKNMLKYRKKVALERISIEQYNLELDNSIEQIKKGEVYTHKEIGERIKVWAKK
jgi:hypothetical protein